MDTIEITTYTYTTRAKRAFDATMKKGQILFDYFDYDTTKSLKKSNHRKFIEF